ncbi:metal-activated pyridoxal enzyme [Sporormia fimetaria CBS 119925]|uniref:Metal-activated pyridoxal enzyme n=1 Tax=Sporormia fimetaria CBS 119925 TaxID=1340428 RepID=A0A6A6VIM3_9PLEO|nr:metal-activated pyridoxal enzyme [Sporormia fimetaria CBS 119925]
MPYSPKPGTPISALDTPSILVDLPTFHSNIQKLTQRLLPTGVRIRPHLKTSKSAAVARHLSTAGCQGFCVAKLSEAEIMVGLGITDLLITCEVIGDVKVGRLVELWGKEEGSDVRVIVDCIEGVKKIEMAMREAGLTGKRSVLVDLDVGLQRTGVRGVEAARELARYIRDECEMLELIGIQGYEGHVQHIHGDEARKTACLNSMKILVETAEALGRDGHDIRVVTCGGTGTAEVCASIPGITEVQPGSFVFMDTDYQSAIGGFYDNSLTILCTVISKQGPKRVTIDAGLKALTTDSGLAQCKDSRYTYGVLGDEHGFLTWTDARDLEVGDRVEMVPSHIDPTVNLFDVYFAHREGVVEEVRRVGARGMVQCVLGCGS